MTIKDVQIKRIALNPNELEDGSYNLVGTLKVRGVLDADLAKALKVKDVGSIGAVKSFKIKREEETVSFDLVSLSGKETLVSVLAAQLHEWQATRRGDNDVLVTVQARINSEAHSDIAAFMQRHPGWSGTMEITAAQREFAY